MKEEYENESKKVGDNKRENSNSKKGFF